MDVEDGEEEELVNAVEVQESLDEEDNRLMQMLQED